jgi:WD40 repeat protein
MPFGLQLSVPSYAVIPVWQGSALQKRYKLDRLSGVVTSACFTPSGRWMISTSAGSGRCLCLWELATGDMWEIPEDADSVVSVSISPDGSWVLAGADDGTLHLWELDWEYAFPGWTDRDEPGLGVVLSRCPENSTRPAMRPLNRKVIGSKSMVGLHR